MINPWAPLCFCYLALSVQYHIFACGKNETRIFFLLKINVFIQKTSLGIECANENIYKCELIHAATTDEQKEEKKNEKQFIVG